MSEPLLLGGAILGIAAATYATFVTVSYLEVKDKIDRQIASGEDPYELQVEQKPRKKPAQKKSNPKRRK